MKTVIFSSILVLGSIATCTLPVSSVQAGLKETIIIEVFKPKWTHCGPGEGCSPHAPRPKPEPSPSPTPRPGGKGK
jgi:hypothetical protein